MISEDETGLRFETLLPDTSYARDLAALVARGDVDEGSFGFECICGRHTGPYLIASNIDPVPPAQGSRDK